jgi:hypothetical protein
MECEQAQQALLYFVYAHGDDSSTAMLSAHLMQCIDCREVLAELVLVQAMGRVARDQWGHGKPSGCQ